MVFLCVCISGGGFTMDQISVMKRKNTGIFIVLFTKCSKCNDKENVSETMEFTWILFIVFPIISTLLRRQNNNNLLCRKWLVSLPVFDLDFANVCHFPSVFPDSLFSFTVLFSSPLCIIPLLTSIKSLHPQTDQREGLSVSLLIPSLLDEIDHLFHQHNNVFFSFSI